MDGARAEAIVSATSWGRSPRTSASHPGTIRGVSTGPDAGARGCPISEKADPSSEESAREGLSQGAWFLGTRSCWANMEPLTIPAPRPPWSCTVSVLVGSLGGTHQIKSNHFYCHITTAQVPWWVKFLRACSRQCKKKQQQQFTYGQYIFTDCTEDNVQNTHTYTQYTQCTIKTYFVTNAPIHIIHRIYTSALCTHLCIVTCEGVTDYNLQ